MNVTPRPPKRRFAFQAVHMLAEGDITGRNLSRPALRRGFESCAA
jgi:hypothetical protein